AVRSHGEIVLDPEKLEMMFSGKELLRQKALYRRMASSNPAFFRRTTVNKPVHGGGTPDVQEQVADLLEQLTLPGDGSSRGEALLDRRSSFSGEDRLFYDLVSYTSGLNTRAADILAVLEAEAAPNPHNRPGRIDKEARRLFDKARSAGWQSLTFPADGEQP